MRNVKVSALQFSCTRNVEENIKKADEMVREAAKKGANIILLPELFERQYFCQESLQSLVLRIGEDLIRSAFLDDLSFVHEDQLRTFGFCFFGILPSFPMKKTASKRFLFETAPS